MDRCKASDGGVFHVEEGGTATFSIPVSFEGNSVSTGRSGGALSIDGTVSRIMTASSSYHLVCKQVTLLVLMVPEPQDGVVETAMSDTRTRMNDSAPHHLPLW